MREAEGLAIRFARQRKRRSQRQVADTTGLDRGHLSRIETGTGDPTGTTLDRIAEALEMDMEDVWLLCIEELRRLRAERTREEEE